jgi:rhodanese-related sulfurtransferase
MNPLYVVLIFIALFIGFRVVGNMIMMKPAEAAEQIAAGEAVLIDVREPGEWSGGVAGPARLHAMSDLRGPRQQWERTLEEHRGKTLLLYCASGVRSGMAARLLKAEGHRAQNIGGIGRWIRSGQPTRSPTAAELP